MSRFYAFVKVFTPNSVDGRFEHEGIIGEMYIEECALNPLITVKNEQTTLFALCVPPNCALNIYERDCLIIENRALFEFEREEYVTELRDVLSAMQREQTAQALGSIEEAQEEVSKTVLISSKQRPLPLAKNGVFELVEKKPDLISVRQAMGVLFRVDTTNIGQLYLGLNEALHLLQQQKLGDEYVSKLCGKLLTIAQISETMVQIRAMKVLTYAADNYKPAFALAIAQFDGILALSQILATAYRLEKQSGKVFVSSELLLSILGVLHRLLSFEVAKASLYPDDKNLCAPETKTLTEVQHIFAQSALKAEQLYEQLEDILELLYEDANACVSISRDNVVFCGPAPGVIKSQQMQSCGIIINLLSDLAQLRCGEQLFRKVEAARTAICVSVEQIEMEVAAFLEAQAEHHELEYLVQSGYFSDMAKMFRLLDACIRNYFCASTSAVETFISEVFNATNAIERALKACYVVLISNVFYGAEFDSGFAFSSNDTAYYRHNYEQLIVLVCAFTQSLSLFLQRYIRDFEAHEDLYESVELLAVRSATLLSLGNYSSVIDELVAAKVFDTFVGTVVDAKYFEQAPISIELYEAFAAFFSLFGDFEGAKTGFTERAHEMLANIASIISSGYDNGKNVEAIRQSRITQAISVLALRAPELSVLEQLLTKAAVKMQGELEQLEIAPFVLLSAGASEKELQGIVDFVSKTPTPYIPDVDNAIEEYCKHLCEIVIRGGKLEYLHHLFQVARSIHRQACNYICTSDLLQLFCEALKSGSEDMIALFDVMLKEAFGMARSNSEWLVFLYNDATLANCHLFNILIQSSLKSLSNRANSIILFGLAAFCFNFFNKQAVEYYNHAKIDVLAPEFSVFELLGIESQAIPSSSLLQLVNADAALAFLQRGFDSEVLLIMQRVMCNCKRYISASTISDDFREELYKLTLESIEKEDPTAETFMDVFMYVADLGGKAFAGVDYARLLKGVASSLSPREEAISWLLRCGTTERRTPHFIDAVFESLPKFSKDVCDAAVDFLEQELDIFGQADLFSSVLKHENYISNLLHSQICPTDRIALLVRILECFENQRDSEAQDPAMARLQLKSAILVMTSTGALEKVMEDMASISCPYSAFVTLLNCLTRLICFKEFHIIIDELSTQFALEHAAYLLLIYISPCRTPSLVAGQLNRLPPLLQESFRQMQREEACTVDWHEISVITRFLVELLQVRRMESTLEPFCDYSFMKFAGELQFKAFNTEDEDAQIDASNLLLSAVQVGEQCTLSYIEGCLDGACEKLIVNLSSLMESVQREAESQKVRFVQHTVEILHTVSQTTAHKVRLCQSENFVAAIGKCIVGCQSCAPLKEWQLRAAQVLQNVVCQDTLDLLICEEEEAGVPIIHACIAYFERGYDMETVKTLLHVLAKMLQSYQRNVAKCIREHGQELYYCVRAIDLPEAAKVLTMLE